MKIYCQKCGSGTEYSFNKPKFCSACASSFSIVATVAPKVIKNTPKITQIEETLVRLEKEAKDFKTELVRLSWYMRGGVTVNDMLYTYSYEDRTFMYQVIKENIETSNKTGIPMI